MKAFLRKLRSSYKKGGIMTQREAFAQLQERGEVPLPVGKVTRKGVN